MEVLVYSLFSQGFFLISSRLPLTWSQDHK
jgi:hypothetical protein